MKSDLIFRKVSEKEKKQIKISAKKIIDVFSEELSKIDLDEKEPLIKRKFCERKESDKKEEDFSKKIFFENAPNKNKNFIISEKKKW